MDDMDDKEAMEDMAKRPTSLPRTRTGTSRTEDSTVDTEACMEEAAADTEVNEPERPFQMLQQLELSL